MRKKKVAPAMNSTENPMLPSAPPPSAQPPSVPQRNVGLVIQRGINSLLDEVANFFSNNNNNTNTNVVTPLTQRNVAFFDRNYNSSYVVPVTAIIAAQNSISSNEKSD